MDEAGSDVREQSLSPSRRVHVAVALLLAAAVIVGGWWWRSGGDRVYAEGGYGVGGPGQPGEPVYIGHLIRTSGPVELRSVQVRPIESTGPLDLDLDVVLIRVHEGQDIPLRVSDLDGYEVEPIAGAVVDGSDDTEFPIAMVMVGVTASDVGAWASNGIEVTYQSGIHPPRTAIIDPKVCLLVTTDLGTALAEEVPPGVDPAHWTVYRSCQSR